VLVRAAFGSVGSAWDREEAYGHTERHGAVGLLSGSAVQPGAESFAVVGVAGTWGGQQVGTGHIAQLNLASVSPAALRAGLATSLLCLRGG
jgi:hypothetical protein